MFGDPDDERFRAARTGAEVAAQLAVTSDVDEAMIAGVVCGAWTFALANSIISPERASAMLRAMADAIEQQGRSAAAGHA